MQIFAPHAKDFYKGSHVHQLPEKLDLAYANYTPRSGSHRNVPGDKVVFLGLQLFAKDYLIHDWNTTFFNKPKEKVCKKYHRRLKNGLGREISIKHIRALHDLGYLPIRIKALPEGSVVPYGVPPFTVVNTRKGFGWLPNMIESVLSAEIWPSMTSATTYNEYRKMFEFYAMKTVGNIDFVPFQGHDFSFRGMMGRHAAALSGFGHLAAGSYGTDTIPAIDVAEDYYGADSDTEMVGMGCAATEHFVMCAGGNEDGEEIETLRRLICDLYPDGLISVVSDTWDFWQLVIKYLAELKPEIMARQGKLVIRPDSGDPVRIICGYTEDEITRYDNKVYVKEMGEVGSSYAGKELMECEVKGLVQCLWDIFGGTITPKKYKMLDEHIGAIYGDSITFGRALAIMERLEAKGFASDNIVLGIGSYTYQHVTRDTHGMAMKATYVEIDGVGKEIFKDPKTDDGTKKSAKGLLMVVQTGKEFVLVDQVSKKEEARGALEVVFENSEMIKEVTLNEIRETVRSFD